MLPPPMQPQVLRRILADQPLEGGRVTLSENADIIRTAFQFRGIDHVFAEEFVSEARADPARDADNDRR